MDTLERTELAMSEQKVIRCSWLIDAWDAMPAKMKQMYEKKALCRVRTKYFMKLEMPRALYERYLRISNFESK